MADELTIAIGRRKTGVGDDRWDRTEFRCGQCGAYLNDLDSAVMRAAMAMRV